MVPMMISRYHPRPGIGVGSTGQPMAFSTSLAKEPLGREPENWWTTCPSRTTANVGIELTPKERAVAGLASTSILTNLARSPNSAATSSITGAI